MGTTHWFAAGPSAARSPLRRIGAASDPTGPVCLFVCKSGPLVCLSVFGLVFWGRGARQTRTKGSDGKRAFRELRVVVFRM
eukprot:380030-Pyramimonas_sp.AAC.1